MNRFCLAVLATMTLSLSFETFSENPAAQKPAQFTAEGVATTFAVPIVNAIMDLFVVKGIAKDWAVFNASQNCVQSGLNAQRVSPWKYTRAENSITARATFTCSSEPTNTGKDVSFGY